MLSRRFAKVDKSGAILSVQTLFPPLDLAVAQAGLPDGERFVPLDDDPAFDEIQARPRDWVLSGPAFQRVPGPPEAPLPLDDLRGLPSLTPEQTARILLSIAQALGLMR